MSELIMTIVSISALAMGVGIGYALRKQLAAARANSIEAIAEKKLTEIKNKEQTLLLQAKEKALKIIEEAKNDEEKRRQEVQKLHARLDHVSHGAKSV